MNEIPKMLLPVCIYLTSTQLFAAGWSELGGTLSDGREVLVYPAWESDNLERSDYSEDAWNRIIEVVTIDKTGASISSEWKLNYSIAYCIWRNSEDVAVPEFVCEKNGLEPFSGAKYKIEQNINPKDCTYSDKYTCVEGCANSNTPKVMYKSYWECPQ